LNSATSFDNCYEPAWQHRGQTVRTWGKDNTGLIEYRFNSQGYRHAQTYNWPAEWAFFGNSIVFGVGVSESDILTSYFDHSQNYGLSGHYMNHHSVTNLKHFVESECFRPQTHIVFFWIDRDSEDINQLIQQVNSLAPKCLNISSGQQRPGTINLMPDKDSDVSGTHPGPRTHEMWAKTIKLLYRA
jgi:hypothetical protein